MNKVFSINTGELFALTAERLSVATGKCTATFALPWTRLLFVEQEVARMIADFNDEAINCSGKLFLSQTPAAVDLHLVDLDQHLVGIQHLDHGIYPYPAYGLVPIRCTVEASSSSYGERVGEMNVYSPIQEILSV